MQPQQKETGTITLSTEHQFNFYYCVGAQKTELHFVLRQKVQNDWEYITHIYRLMNTGYLASTLSPVACTKAKESICM